MLAQHRVEAHPKAMLGKTGAYLGKAA